MEALEKEITRYTALFLKPHRLPTVHPPKTDWAKEIDKVNLMNDDPAGRFHCQNAQ